MDTGESVLRDRETPFQSAPFLAPLSKGNQVNIPGLGYGYLRRPRSAMNCGNATKLGDVGRGPGKSSLFFLTVMIVRFDDPGIRLSGEGVR